LAKDDSFPNSNVKLVVRHLPKNYDVKITLKKILPILARIPGSFGIFVKII